MAQAHRVAHDPLVAVAGGLRDVVVGDLGLAVLVGRCSRPRSAAGTRYSRPSSTARSCTCAVGVEVARPQPQHRVVVDDGHRRAVLVQVERDVGLPVAHDRRHRLRLRRVEPEVVAVDVDAVAVAARVRVARRPGWPPGRTGTSCVASSSTSAGSRSEREVAQQLQARLAAGRLVAVLRADESAVGPRRRAGPRARRLPRRHGRSAFVADADTACGEPRPRRGRASSRASATTRRARHQRGDGSRAARSSAASTPACASAAARGPSAASLARRRALRACVPTRTRRPPGASARKPRARAAAVRGLTAAGGRERCAAAPRPRVIRIDRRLVHSPEASRGPRTQVARGAGRTVPGRSVPRPGASWRIAFSIRNRPEYVRP